jgi:hypothetical protein
MLQTAKGVVVLKDELVGWVKSMDQYRGGKRADRQHFLSFWSRQTVKADWQGAPTPILISRPHLSVCGGIPPDLLSNLADTAQREDGFLDRLLWCFPAPVRDRWTDEGIRLEMVRVRTAVFSAGQLLQTMRIGMPQSSRCQTRPASFGAGGTPMTSPKRNRPPPRAGGRRHGRSPYGLGYRLGTGIADLLSE